MVKQSTRYRVTVNGESKYRDARPTDAELERIESFILCRGGHARVDECRTEVDTSLIGTGRGVKLSDRCLFEIEG